MAAIVEFELGDLQPPCPRDRYRGLQEGHHAVAATGWPGELHQSLEAVQRLRPKHLGTDIDQGVVAPACQWHLLGHDHDTPEHEAAMWSRQAQALEAGGRLLAGGSRPAVSGDAHGLPERLGRADVARATYERALEIDRDFRPALRFRAADAERVGDADLAIAHVLPYLGKPPARIAGAASIESWFQNGLCFSGAANS